MSNHDSAISRLVFALDVPTVVEAEKLYEKTKGQVGVYKIGYHLLYSGGLGLVETMLANDEAVFLDTKLLDIGNTVASAVEALCRLGPTFITLHAYHDVMRAAVVTRNKLNSSTKLLGVTVLTSMNDVDLKQTGYGCTIDELIAIRSRQAKVVGMDGLVCSPREVGFVRSIIGNDMLLLTPGIRPFGYSLKLDDQKRTMTPYEAIRAGADYIVVGRPLFTALKTEQILEALLVEIECGLRARTGI